VPVLTKDKHMGQDNPEEGLSLQLHNSNFTPNPLPSRYVERFTAFRTPASLFRLGPI